LMLQLLGGKHEHTAARPWGRIGFKYRSRDGNPRPETVNVGDLAVRFPGQGEIDLEAAGIGKLLGSGSIGHKVVVRVDQASPGAIEKVQAAGGQVTVLSPPQKKAPAPAAAPAKGEAKAPSSKGDKPAKADKPAGDKPKGDKPAGEKASKADRPAGDKPKGDKPAK
ncbi:MAG TPA: uL15m family ribosomal protein, partial [Candidatus Thermoplasmatota archaeon]|nr:uL15m family ribosomal protein [Candidatus Thermoplasmatota archaeon]